MHTCSSLLRRRSRGKNISTERTLLLSEEDDLGVRSFCFLQLCKLFLRKLYKLAKNKSRYWFLLVVAASQQLND